MIRGNNPVDSIKMWHDKAANNPGKAAENWANLGHACLCQDSAKRKERQKHYRGERADQTGNRHRVKKRERVC